MNIFLYLRQANNLYNKTVLSNGLTIISDYMPEAKSFALGLCVGAGSRDDFKNCDGLAHFVEHSVFRRTKHMTSKKISEEFENLGAYTNAYTTKENICFYVRALKEFFPKILNLIYSITIEPIFVDIDINKERSIITEEIKSYFDDPEELIADYADKELYRGSPLEHPIIGNEASVAAITRDNIADFHAKYFVPSNLVLACTGNVPHEEIIRLAEHKFGKFAGEPLLEKRPELPPYSAASNIMEKDYAQNHILYCKRVCPYSHEDKYALSALNFILGEGTSSRLNQAIREKGGMVYTVYSNLHTFSDSGILSIYAGSERKNIAKIRSHIDAEIEKLLAGKITEKELMRAKAQLKSGILMSVENIENYMQSLAKEEFILGHTRTAEEIISSIEAISIGDINRITDKYLQTDDWSRIIFRIS